MKKAPTKDQLLYLAKYHYVKNHNSSQMWSYIMAYVAYEDWVELYWSTHDDR